MTNETNAALSALRTAKRVAENDFTNTSAIVQNVDQAIALLEASQRETQVAEVYRLEMDIEATKIAEGYLTVGDADDLLVELSEHIDRRLAEQASQREAPVAEGVSEEEAKELFAEFWNRVKIERWRNARREETLYTGWMQCYAALSARLTERPSVTNVSREEGAGTPVQGVRVDAVAAMEESMSPESIARSDEIFERLSSQLHAPAPGKAADEGISAELELLTVHRLEVPRFDDDDNETVIREFWRVDDVKAALRSKP